MSFKFKAMVLATGVSTLLAVATGSQAQQGQPQSDYFVVQQTQGVPHVSLGGTVVPYKEVTLSAQLPGRVKFLGIPYQTRFRYPGLSGELDVV